MVVCVLCLNGFANSIFASNGTKEASVILHAAQEEINNLENKSSFQYHASWFMDSTKSPGVKTRSSIRYLCKRSNHSNVAVLSGIGGTPRCVYFNDVFYSLDVDKNAWIAHPNNSWQFRFDKNSYSMPLTTSRQLNENANQIKIDLISFMLKVLGENPSKALWDVNSRFLTQQGRNSNQFYLSLRGVVDSKQYGSELSSVGAINKDLGCTQILGLCNKPIPYATVAINDAEELDSGIGDLVKEPTSTRVKITLGTIADSPNISAHKMYCSLRRDAFNKEYTFPIPQIQKETFYLLASGTHTLDVSIDDSAGNTIACHAFASGIELLIDGSLELFENELAYPCDPYMRWFRTEHIVGPEITNLTYLQTITFLDKHKSTPSVRYELIEAVTTLGIPVSNIPDSYIDRSLKDSFEEAIFRSRVYKPCSEKHIQACQEVLDQKQTVAQIKYIAVHTLALLGSLDRVAPELVDSWIQNRLIETSVQRRSRYLDQLLDNEATRKFFRYSIAKEKLPPELVKIIESKLKHFPTN